MLELFLTYIVLLSNCNGESYTRPKCIHSVQDLVQMYKEENTIFSNFVKAPYASSTMDIHFVMKYITFGVYYRIGSYNSSDQPPGCCRNFEDEDNCSALFNHYHRIYDMTPAIVLWVLGNPSYIVKGRHHIYHLFTEGLGKFCWNIPSFCSMTNSNKKEILADFTLIVSKTHTVCLYMH